MVTSCVAWDGIFLRIERYRSPSISSPGSIRVEALLNRRETKKAKSGIPLLHHARLFEPTIARCEFSFAAVFGYHEAVRSEYRPAAAASEKIKRALVFVLGLVGGIEKDEIQWL